MSTVFYGFLRLIFFCSESVQAQYRQIIGYLDMKCRVHLYKLMIILEIKIKLFLALDSDYIRHYLFVYLYLSIGQKVIKITLTTVIITSVL